MSEDDPHLTAGDFRRVYCMKGVRKVFAECGLDFSRFLEEGARASELRGLGHDAMVDRVVETKTRQR